jgi:hypothetical protein
MTERLVAVALLVVSVIYLAQAMGMPLGSTARPGAGFYPMVVGVFACVVALVAVAMAFPRRREPAEAGEVDEDVPGARLQVWLTVVTLAAFCLLLPWIGYPLAALLFVCAQLRQLGASWRRALLAGLIGAEGSYYLFAILLGVTLPRGLWPH